MTQNLLRNGDFETDWGEEKSHRCLVIPFDDKPYERPVDNIFTPPGWVTYFIHEPGKWDQPEVRDAWAHGDPRRVHSGRKATLLFTFYRKHDAGFFQQVQVEPGKRLRLTAWAHAWSNHSLEGHEGCCDDARCSCGVGRDVVAIPADEIPPLNGNAWNDAIGNFLFSVGIDPTGGTNPYAATVTWGTPYAIYNGYARQLNAEAVAQAETVTVFLRSLTAWKFKHNDTYWDGAELAVVEDAPPPKERGKPRVQYPRTYGLLPPGAGKEWALAFIKATWDRSRWTLGGSADDASIGDLDYRRVVAVNPSDWPSDLAAFYEEHYPGIKYVPVEASTPDALVAVLRSL